METLIHAAAGRGEASMQIPESRLWHFSSVSLLQLEFFLDKLLHSLNSLHSVLPSHSQRTHQPFL